MVAELAAEVSLSQCLAAEATLPLRGVPKAIATPAREPWFEIVEHANTPATERAFQPHPLTHGAAADGNQGHDNGAPSGKVQVERGLV
jgi:hypothetical protein